MEIIWILRQKLERMEFCALHFLRKRDVYGLYSVPTGQMTKRSGLGGEGLVIGSV